jgi:hypothetical protein
MKMFQNPNSTLYVVIETMLQLGAAYTCKYAYRRDVYSVQFPVTLS